jgi:hypothetical protein
VQRPRRGERSELLGLEASAYEIDRAAGEQLAKRQGSVAAIAEQTRERRLGLRAVKATAHQAQKGLKIGAGRRKEGVPPGRLAKPLELIPNAFGPRE